MPFVEYDSDKIKKAIKASQINHTVVILADNKEQLNRVMSKIKRINNKKYKIYNEFFNNRKNCLTLTYPDVIYSGETIQNQTRLRGRRVEQIIYVGDKSLWEIKREKYTLDKVMKDMLSRSCVPEEFQIQKWEV